MPKRTTHIIGQAWASAGPNRNGDIYPTVHFSDTGDTTVFAIAQGIAAELQRRHSHVSFSVKRRAVLDNMSLTEGMTVEPNAASVYATVGQKTIFEIRLFDTIVLVTPLVIDKPNPQTTDLHMEDYTDRPVGAITAEVVKGEFEYAHPRSLERLYEACRAIVGQSD